MAKTLTILATLAVAVLATAAVASAAAPARCTVPSTTPTLHADGCAQLRAHQAMRLPAGVTEVELYSADGRVRLHQIEDRRAQHAWIFDGVSRHGRALNALWDVSGKRTTVVNGEATAVGRLLLEGFQQPHAAPVDYGRARGTVQWPPGRRRPQ